MDIVKLRWLISQSPYDAMSADELVVALNAPTERVQGVITKGRMIMWAGSNGGFTAMQAACNFESQDEALQLSVRNVGLAAAALFNGGDVAEFDTSAPVNVSMLSLLVSVGLLTQAAADALLDAGATMMSPAQLAGVGGFVNVGDIAEARA